MLAPVALGQAFWKLLVTSAGGSILPCRGPDSTQMHLASSNSLSASLSPSPSHERPLVFPTGYTLVSVFGILSVHGQDLETSQIPAVPLPNFGCTVLCEQDTLAYFFF